MIRFIVWLALGYASCVWDCSCNPEHVRWPSTTAVFVLLLAMREPRYAIWGAGICGLAIDAAQGGILGPRMLAGVVLATLARALRISHAETSRLRVGLLVFVLSLGWLLAPGLASQEWIPTFPAIEKLGPPLLGKCISTTLLTMAIRCLQSTDL